jgi:hypothetical protein
MKKYFLALAVVVFIGCDTCQVKIKKSTSLVESLAEKWEQGDDSVLEKTHFDAWSNKIVFKVDERENTTYLEVKSNGPDGLPFTSDDIKAMRSRKKKTITQIEDAVGKERYWK